MNAKSDYAEKSFERSDTLRHDQLPTFMSSRYAEGTSYLDIACDKLARVAEALGIAESERAKRTALLRKLCTPWGHQSASSPRYFSNISLEGMPFELSHAWSNKRGNELRITFETFGESPTPVANLEAGRRFTRALTDIPELASPGLVLDSYFQVEDLFVGPEPFFLFPMGHGLSWPEGRDTPFVKIYLNPNINGFDEGLTRTNQAMERLGAGEAWAAVSRHFEAIGAPAPVPVFVCLEFADVAGPRIKVYYPNSGVSAEMMDRQAEVVPGHVKGSFERAITQVTGQSMPEWAKVPASAVTVKPGEDRPTSITFYMPLIPVVESDAAARDRVCALSANVGLDSSAYESVLEAFADQPLSESQNHHFVALTNLSSEDARLAIYLAPGVYKR